MGLGSLVTGHASANGHAVQLLPLLFVAGIIYLSFDRSRGPIKGEDESDDGQTDPVEELKERYIWGDLSEAEFEQKLEEYLETGETSESPHEGEGL